MSMDKKESGEVLHFLDFPVELIIAILEYLPIGDLNQMCETCRRMREVCSRLAIWRKLGKRYLNFESHGTSAVDNMTIKEQCRIAHNWSTGFYSEHHCKKFKTGLLPWLQLSSDHLYVSVMNKICRYKLKPGGRLHPLPSRRKESTYSGHSQDISKFVVKENNIVSCGGDGRVMVWDEASGRTIQAIQANMGRLTSVDATREVIVTGTNHVGVVMFNQSDGRELRSVHMRDRVWSVAVDPSQRIFATGTSGTIDLNSLKVWNIETAENLLICGENRRHGEGILDLKFESPNILLSAGYDTFIRQWDIRTPREAVLEFEEPSDNAVYCISSDNSNFIAAGYCRHGIVRFWDKRRKDQCIQTFYVGGKIRSPVYSLQFNQHCLYVALSHDVYLLDFGAYKSGREDSTKLYNSFTSLSPHDHLA